MVQAKRYQRTDYSIKSQLTANYKHDSSSFGHTVEWTASRGAVNVGEEGAASELQLKGRKQNSFFSDFLAEPHRLETHRTEWLYEHFHFYIVDN